MANQWFRMYSDFLNDPKMISLAFEDQRHFIGILALKSDGTLDQECDEKLRERIIAQRLWIDYAILSDVKKRLVNAGLINNSWQPLAWEKRQFVSDSSAARTRAYRDRLKRHGDVTVTPPDTDTESDTESEAESDTENEAGSEPNPSMAASCCQQMRVQGIAQCNPSHPALLALIKAGATKEEFEQAAKAAIDRGKNNFAYVVGIVKRQREEAAKLVLHQGRLPNKQEALEQSNRAATDGWVPPELRETKNAN